MDFRQLETFIEVAKLQSFSRAADKLFITQPTVTNHIQNLEKELGTILINRMGKKISLTKAGKLLYKNALNIINAFEMTKFELDAFKGHIHGQLEIASSSVPRKYLLPVLMYDFLCMYPDVVFSIHDNDSKEVISRILDGNYDFGFVGAKYESYNLEYIKIMDDKLVLITPLKFREDLKNFDEIQLQDIINSNLILREVGSGTRETLENSLKALNICMDDLKIIAYIEDTEAIKELVSLGAGLSFLSEKAVKNDLGNGKYKTLYINDLNFNRDFYFVYHKKRQLSPLGETFKEFVLK
ncbi:selenium metabolism-associated LysR family transcriptional regulator [Tissierella sp. Yu-01]|uniref:selenium metabolism-associated LysR family transcriptional regulator n=1 Tax=Tissierella sp. Yu-01 TaxID=3035694 RepID=UPI00240E0420|nr:selenium metabolism-associated LysR family transcriptional regulator [Tissierella sp. Yu-01]WFA09443.1 selenium metabolism-associated LysR family transcriptional regulator [Tissierella sp. Yu-01]